MIGERPLSQQLARVLACFAGAPGQVRLTLRSYSGLELPRVLVLPPMVPGLGTNVMQALIDGDHARIHVATLAGDGTFLALPSLVVPFALESEFVDGRHQVRPDEIERVRASLEAMPSPSFNIDGAFEQWVGWRLARPVVDWADAGAACATAAVALGGVPIEDLAIATTPFGGTIRNWSNSSREAVTILRAEPEPRYTLEELLFSLPQPAAIQEPDHDEPSRTRAVRRRRAGRDQHASGA